MLQPTDQQDEESASLLRSTAAGRRSSEGVGSFEGYIPNLAYLAGDYADIWLLSTNSLGDSETKTFIAQVIVINECRIISCMMII